MSGFIEVEAPELPLDPFSITSDSTCGGEYEYMRRYTTLNSPTDIGNVIINRLYITDWLTVGDCQPNQTAPLPFIEPLSQVLRPKDPLNLKRGFYVQDTVGIGLTTDEKVDRTTQLYIDTTYNPDAILALKVIGGISINGDFLLSGIATATSFSGDASGLSNVSIPGISTSGTSTFNQLNVTGSLGIGVTNPTSALDVFGTGTDKWHTITINGNSTVDNTNKGGIIRGARKNNSSVPFSAFGTWDDGTGRYLYIGGGGWSCPDATGIGFYTESTYSETNENAVERMTIVADGNIGINNTNPTSKLHVTGGDIRVGVDTSQGLILTSPNGTKYRLIVSNAGALSTVLVP